MLRMRRPIGLLALVIGVSLACNYRPVQRTVEAIPVAPVEPAATQAAQVEPAARRLLTVCMGQEPASLFLYADQSAAARAIREAIYDGPFDWVNFTFTPVILQTAPNSADGSLALTPVTVQSGEPLVDVTGKVVKLGEGVSYYPAGCGEASCVAAYTGQQPVQVDQLVARFSLRAGLQWADGSPLTADDSVYSYEIARGLYPLARAELIDRTQSYQASNETTVEWRGLPGYRTSRVLSAFFTPLPRHAWKDTPLKDLPAAEAAARKPLGWGPYTIDEWTPGDHISLSRNPTYFRAAEGLPAFDQLVFRFMPDRAQAVNALQSGECDVLDESLHLEVEPQPVLDLQTAGKARLAFMPGLAWEHLDFGLLPATSAQDGGPLPLFQAKETRQAIAQCLDRTQLAQEAFGAALVGAAAAYMAPPASYVPAGNPLLSPDLKPAPHDPPAAAALLEAAGWKDEDANPATPRLARGVSGVPDGTPFEVAFLTSDEPEKQRVAQAMQTMLAGCGIKMNIDARTTDVVFAAGPQGPIFGRSFSLAQFGWVSAIEPPCFLFTTAEIPGPYPEFPRGWGGANAAGYSSPEFDRLCRQALAALPDAPAHQQAHFQAQAILAADAPIIPLYPRLKLVAARPDFCNLTVDPSSENALWNLEQFSYGATCAP